MKIQSSQATQSSIKGDGLSINIGVMLKILKEADQTVIALLKKYTGSLPPMSEKELQKTLKALSAINIDEIT